MNDYCPYCGGIWCGEVVDDVEWVEYSCWECGYEISVNLYTSSVIVNSDSQLEMEE